MVNVTRVKTLRNEDKIIIYSVKVHTEMFLIFYDSANGGFKGLREDGTKFKSSEIKLRKHPWFNALLLFFEVQ